MTSSFSIVIYLLAATLLAFPVKAIQFDCNFGFFSPWIGPRYTCHATVINSSSSALESVTGVHETGRSDDDVEYLYIRNQNLPFIPEGIANFFRNLDSLAISETSLMSISANDLRPFPRLLFIYLYGQQLTSIDGDLFTYTPHLQQVHFNFNLIQHIGHDLVTGLNNLTILYLQGNVCIDQVAGNRADVLSLGPRLSVFCPPLNIQTTEATTTTEITTTTDKNIDQCMCDGEIEELHELNRDLRIHVNNLQESNTDQNRKIEQQSEEIEQLQLSNEQLIQVNAAFEKRLLEVEMRLIEIGSTPCSN